MSLNLANLSNLSAHDAQKVLKEQLASLSIDQRYKVMKRLERSIYENDLYEFARALGYTKVDWEVHEPILRVLESSSRCKLIVVPRGCFKSTLCSVVYPVWRHVKNPNMRIIIDSELLTNSSKFLREIEGHLLGEFLTYSYGPLKTRDKTWNSTEIITALKKDHSKKEASFTASGIGAQKTSQHYDLACLDDLSTPRNITTPESRQKVIDHYRYYTSLLDPDHGEKVIVGTRYHELDLIGWIIENELDSEQRIALGF